MAARKPRAEKISEFKITAVNSHPFMTSLAPETIPNSTINTPEYIPRRAPAMIWPIASRCILVGEYR